MVHNYNTQAELGILSENHLCITPDINSYLHKDGNTVGSMSKILILNVYVCEPSLDGP